MLLHDSYLDSSNRSINTTRHGIITVAYSPLFHSTFTLIISIFGLLFNLTCWIKIWFVIYQYRQRKLQNNQQPPPQESIHVLSHNRYRFLLILTSNDSLLCLSSIISCLDEKYFFQSFLARHHLCASHILIWKFTLHFIPLLTIVILCRYHYILNKTFQVRSSNLSTLNQLLCTDLSIVIAFVLALAWSVDGLWLWGVANIENFIKRPSSLNNASSYPNKTIDIITTSPVNNNNINTTSFDSNFTLIESVEQNYHSLYLPQQKTICYLQTDHNYEVSVRLVHLIQADFLLLFSLHLIGLFLEIVLHIRLCCCVVIKKATLAFDHERQLCIYILYIFLILTITSLPFYLYRALEMLFDSQLASLNNDLINSRTFAQILLMGTCFKPLLFFILFFPPSILFYLKVYLKCYSPANIDIVEQEEQLVSLSNNQTQNPKQQEPITRLHYHRYSLFIRSSYHPKSHSKLRTKSNPILPTSNYRQNSLPKSEHLNNWLKATHSIITDEPIERSINVHV